MESSDPSNIYDATLAAAGYLCTGDRDLSRTSDLRAAIFGYNHSSAYVDTVLAWARAYASGGGQAIPPASGGGGRPCLRRRQQRRLVQRPLAAAERDAHIDTEVNADPHPDAQPVGDADVQPRDQRARDRDAHSYADTDQHADRDRLPHADTDPDRLRDPHGQPEPDADADADTDGRPDGHAFPHPDGPVRDAFPDPDRHVVGGPVTHADTLRPRRAAQRSAREAPA